MGANILNYLRIKGNHYRSPYHEDTDRDLPCICHTRGLGYVYMVGMGIATKKCIAIN